MRARSCIHTTPARRTFSPRRAFLPAFHSCSYLPPYIPPHGAQPRPLPYIPFPCLAASLSVDHQARTPPSVLPSVKFSSGRARRSGYFVPFCRPLLCLPYSLHAAVSARRYTQRKQAYSRSRAPYLYSSVSTFYTLKKKFCFLQKSLHISKILTTFANVRWKSKTSYSFFELIVYLYI